MWKRTLKLFSHITFASFVLILPVGYVPDSTNSYDLMFSVNGGAGQTASVIRGCEGEALHSVKSPFEDYSASAYVPIHNSGTYSVIGGLRVGRYETDAKFAISTYDYSINDRVYSSTEPFNISYTYINPNFSFETRKIGFGFGYVISDLPLEFSDVQDEHNDNNISRLNWSGHIRLGAIDKGYFLVSFAENEPLIAGGGLLNVGIGYRMGRGGGFTGISGMYYERAGLQQSAMFALSKKLKLDLCVRIGGESEIAGAAGVSYWFKF